MADVAPLIEDLFHQGHSLEHILGIGLDTGWTRDDVMTVLRERGWDLDGSGRLPRSKRMTIPRGLRGLPPAAPVKTTSTTSRHRTTVPDRLDGHPLPTEPPTPTAAAAEQAALDVPLGDPPERWLPPLDDPRLPAMAGSVTVSGDTIARASEIRAQVDAMTPRSVEGEVNAQHVAIEQTLRERHGLPSYVAELDGPGNFLPTPPLPRQRPPAPLAHRGRRPDGRDLDDWLDEACRDDRAHVRRAAERACLLHEQLHDALDDLVRAEHNHARGDR